jgi:D-glycero-D-manno-heptose 1,7-bisphosphate phosphatase
MKLVVLDRDGVINKESPDFIKTPDEWLPLKGSLEAIARLSQAGYSVVVVTNQSGVARKLFTADTLGRIHTRMIDHVQQYGGKIEIIFFCPHHPDDQCDCRKPKTGLYKELAERLNIGFNGVYSVGDSVRDLIAAKSAGANPVLVKTGNGKKSVKQINADPSLNLSDTPVFDSLAAFVDALLENEM